MRTPAFLARSRHAIFYFRWPLPKQLHPRNRPSAVKQSLFTRDPLAALRLARYLAHIAEILTARGMASGMRYDEVRATLKKHFAELVAKRKAGIAENGRLGQREIASLENGAAFALQALSDGSPINPVGDDTPTLDALVAKYNLPVERGSPGYANLHIELKRAYLAYCRSVLAYDRSLDGYDFTGGEDIITEQVLAQAKAVFSLANIHQPFVVPIALKAIGPSLIHIVEYQEVSRDGAEELETLNVANQAVFELVPPVPGIGISQEARSSTRIPSAD